MSSKFISVDNTPVVIQQNQEMLRDRTRQANRKPYNNAVLKGFLRVQPKSLGIVQIMIGMLISLFGIVFTASTVYTGFTVRSGVTYWGSLIYISAGSLSVAAKRKLHPRVVKASLGMNVICAITAGITTIVLSTQLYLINENQCRYFRQDNLCLEHKSLILGIIGILLVLSMLQLVISICISAFACKASCDTCDCSLIDVSIHQDTEEDISSLNKLQQPRRN